MSKVVRVSRGAVQWLQNSLSLYLIYFLYITFFYKENNFLCGVFTRAGSPIPLKRDYYENYTIIKTAPIIFNQTAIIHI